jgi:hypothetical protein
MNVGSGMMFPLPTLAMSDVYYLVPITRKIQATQTAMVRIKASSREEAAAKFEIEYTTSTFGEPETRYIVPQTEWVVDSVRLRQITDKQDE